MEIARLEVYLPDFKSNNSTYMFIFNSSIGKKFVQAISGAFLYLFLLLHVTINFFSVIDSIIGRYGIAAADDKLFTAGDGIFKLGCDFMSTPFISIMVPVLALGFLVHFVYGIWLSIQNVVRRGGIKRYEVSQKVGADSWSAKNMCILGLVIIGFIVYHLTGFWAHMQMPELLGLGVFENNPYILLNFTFGKWWALLLYLGWFFALWLHLTHGFWSMFQTAGWNGTTWFKRVKVIGIIVASLICVLFAATAINAFIQANWGMTTDLINVAYATPGI